MWVKPWILCRKVQGAYNTLFNELLNIDQESFRNYMRMDFCAFEHLLSMIENDVLKKHTVMRQSLSPMQLRQCDLASVRNQDLLRQITSFCMSAVMWSRLLNNMQSWRHRHRDTKQSRRLVVRQRIHSVPLLLRP